MTSLFETVIANNSHAANATWKSMRKASAQLLSNENIRRLGNYQQAEATQLMWDLVHTPEVRICYFVSGGPDSDVLGYRTGSLICDVIQLRSRWESSTANVGYNSLPLTS